MASPSLDFAFLKNGFMPVDPPPTRLPSAYHFWEEVLDDAQGLALGDDNPCPAELTQGNLWRDRLRKVRYSLDVLSRGSSCYEI